MEVPHRRRDFTSSPAIGADGTIYVGSKDYSLYAINADGTQKWKFTTGGFVQSSAAIGTDGTIYFGSVDGNLYALGAGASPTPAPTPTPAPPGQVGTTSSDTTSDAATFVTVNLPKEVSIVRIFGGPPTTSGGFLIAEVAVQTAQNRLCTAGPSPGPAAPFACCTGTGRGNCQNASNATITAPAAQNGAGWTLEDNQTCGTDLQEAIYYRYVQPGDTAATAFTWNFSNPQQLEFPGGGKNIHVHWRGHNSD